MSVELEKKPRWRATALLTFLLTLALILAVQLFRWQVLQHEHFVRMAQAEHNASREIHSLRGTVRDRRGYTLAIDSLQYEISADPPLVADVHQTADRLTPLLDMPRDKIVETLTQDAPHVRLALGVPHQIGETIASWRARGITAKSTPVRVYPEGRLAAHLLGFVNALQDGYYGVEGYYNQRLKGQEGIRQGQRGPLGEIIPVGFREVTPPHAGSSLVLTLDRTVQAMVERELANALTRFGAESGTIIVMEPRTGNILAMASLPSYDPNVYYRWPPEMFSDPAISSQYEPGSVFKIVTIAAGLDAGVITPHSTFYDSGSIEVGGRLIMNSDRLSHGQVDMIDVLALSLNVGSAHISTTLGKERFYAYLRGFGFGRITGVDLGSEGPGRLRLPGDNDWHESDLGTNSFGQGVAVTPLQMTSAVAAVANRGILMRPCVVGQIVNGEKVTIVQPTVVRRVISSHTADQLTGMLVEATKRGAPLATLPNYKVAGKTGTSQIPMPGGYYHPDQTIASFVGYAPADDPRFVMLVKIDKPQASPWGYEVAAPVFASVTEELVNYLDIPPDNVRLAYQ